MKKSFSNLEISILTLLYSFVCYSCLVISYSVVQVTLLRALADSTGTAVGTRLEAPGAGTTGRAAEAGPNPGSGVSMGSGPKVSFEIFVSKIFFHDRYANLGSNPRRNPRRIWLLFGLRFSGSNFLEGHFDHFYGSEGHENIPQSKENSMNFNFLSFLFFKIPRLGQK